MTKTYKEFLEENKQTISEKYKGYIQYLTKVKAGKKISKDELVKLAQKHDMPSKIGSYRYDVYTHYIAFDGKKAPTLGDVLQAMKEWDIIDEIEDGNSSEYDKSDLKKSIYIYIELSK